jgi:hypothetical protein
MTHAGCSREEETKDITYKGILFSESGLKVISLCPVHGGKKRPKGQSLRDGGSGIVCLDLGCVTSVK